MNNETILFEETLPGGGLGSWTLRRHMTLRLTDLEGGANVGLMAYNADQPLDRLNLPDTLQAQHTAKLTRGHVLMSDMGHALLSITTDTVGRHDLVANVNFFSRLDVAAGGGLRFQPGNSAAGAQVDLRAEMNVLVILNTCQHPLDPNPRYAPKPVKLTLLKTPAPGPDDFCRNFRSENQRSFILTERLFLGA
jgi:uncharacterized protein YcgI (DUF1989 family)